MFLVRVLSLSFFVFFSCFFRPFFEICSVRTLQRYYFILRYANTIHFFQHNWRERAQQDSPINRLRRNYCFIFLSGRQQRKPSLLLLCGCCRAYHPAPCPLPSLQERRGSCIAYLHSLSFINGSFFQPRRVPDRSG